jgi:integrase
MAKSIEKLSALTVKGIKVKGRYADGGGLYLQVGPTGNKAWLFRFSRDGKARQMGLGAVATVSLADARQSAHECRKLLQDGIDPIAHREAQRRAMKSEQESLKSFRWCADQYIADHGDGWRNAKHRQQWENTLATYAFPNIGDTPVNEITTDDIISIIKPIWKTKTETASRLRGRIECILGWARHKGYRDGMNPAAWRDNLEHELPGKARVQTINQHPAMHYSDVGQFMAALRQQEGASARALEFLILAAARSGEVIGARWDEIDTRNRLWTVPAGRMKMKVEHNVPLSDDALAVIERQYVIDGNPYLFPGQRKGRPLSNMAMLKLLERMGHGDITVHGFRSTFRDWCAEHTAFPRNIPELCLAHGPKDKVEAAYLRASLLPKRKELLNAWATFCATLPSDRHNVTPIRESAR